MIRRRTFPRVSTKWCSRAGSTAGGFHALSILRGDKREAAGENVELLGIRDLERQCFRDLSGGQKQRVLLARALCATKSLLLLDEPVTGLDPIVTGEFYQLIRRINRDSGIAVVMVSHDIESAVADATHILHLQETALFFGTTEDYSQEPDRQEISGRCA